MNLLTVLLTALGSSCASNINIKIHTLAKRKSPNIFIEKKIKQNVQCPRSENLRGIHVQSIASLSKLINSNKSKTGIHYFT